MVSRVEACVLCFLLALLSPAVSLCAAAAGNTAPLSAGFSLPIVSNHPEILQAAEAVAAPLGDADYNLNYIRPKVAPVVFPTFSVVVGVGTGQRRQFYKLALDFIGSLTWMQCRPSNPEVPQQGPIYNQAASLHFKYVLPTDPDCVPPYTRYGHSKCSFAARFQAATANGYIGTDEFAFASSTGGNHVNSVRDLVFGCSYTTHGFLNHRINAGVMSLSRQPTSFLGQLSQRGVTNLRFSYCLLGPTHARTDRHSYLRFGVDIPGTSNAHSTALLYGGSTTLYYVGLAGISLDGRRLTRITPAMFHRDPHTHHGGTIVDVGTPVTKIIRAAYDILEAEVSAHLRRRGAHIVQVPGYRLCVEARDLRQHHLPDMTLHFHEEGAAKLDIKPQLLFMVIAHDQRAHLCLAVVPDAGKTVIGAGQQADTRFTFDLEEHKLFFAPEQCHEDSGVAA